MQQAGTVKIQSTFNFPVNFIKHPFDKQGNICISSPNYVVCRWIRDLQMQKATDALSTWPDKDKVVCQSLSRCVCVCVRCESSGQEWIFRLEENFSELLLRFPRSGREVLYGSRCHKPGNKVKVKLFLRGTKSSVATVKEREEMMYETNTI